MNKLVGYCNDFSLEWNVTEEKRKKALFLKEKCYNFYVGDIKHADVIVVTGYDTPKRIFFSRFKYLPFDASSNIQDTFINSLVVIIFMIAILVLSGIVIFTNNIFNLSNVLKIIIFGIESVGLLFFASGIPNNNNMNRNTAAMAILLDLMQSLPRNKRIAYAFLDKTADDSMGYKSLSDFLKSFNSHAEIIILDAVGNGKQIVYAQKKNKDYRLEINNQYFKKLELSKDEYSKNPMNFFQRPTLISCGINSNKYGFYVKYVRTRKDAEVDMEKMELVSKTIYGTIMENL